MLTRLWILAFSTLAAAVVAASAPVMAANDGVTRFFSASAADAAPAFDHRTWDELLAKYVVAGSDGVNRVDYEVWQNDDHQVLKGYVKALQAADPRQLNRDEQFAYWANLYNAKTIEIVLDHYPIDSIREISIGEGLLGFIKKSAGLGGPWKAKVVKVAGHELSLDDIEHQILRPIFNDPRVHYAVNCSSFGCPNLGQEAFTGAKLDTQLEAAAKAYVNDPRGFTVEGDTIKASSIYQWFQTDFGGSEEGVLDHARKYANDALESKLEGKKSIDSYFYDWSVNNIKRRS
ncbi:MAG: DUF547 domain-containing protein [Alphaproteobacteria bacterium]|nr:DUF547 domain-containing protein [Alphaproteobacteria bacterium]